MARNQLTTHSRPVDHNVIRLITGFKKRESCKQKFKENRILTVTSLYVLEVLCFIKKYKGSLMQNYMIHEHNTKSKNDLHTEFCNTSLYQKNVIKMGIRLWHYPTIAYAVQAVLAFVDTAQNYSPAHIKRNMRNLKDKFEWLHAECQMYTIRAVKLYVRIAVCGHDKKPGNTGIPLKVSHPRCVVKI